MDKYFILALILLVNPPRVESAYRFGIGIHDITGPAADVIMMGYAKISQVTHGLHTRLFSRAFLIEENDQPERPILFINLDIGMSSQLLKNELLERMKSVYGSKFDHSNVLLSATHTHSGPGGYLQYILYSVTSLGFVKENFDAMIFGIMESVAQAHSNRIHGKIFINEGDLFGSSINRSPVSYLHNPENERAKYPHDVDTKMILLKFVNTSGHPVGMLNWFAVHCTSMNNSNTLISADNKGLASTMFEQHINGNRMLGRGPFIAAFAQANEGDVSPNTNGPRCIDTGEPCDYVTSTCGGRSEKCIAFGPGKDMFESTKIIARKQFEMALQLFQTAKKELEGPIDFRHQFVDMTNVTVKYEGRVHHTCKPAMGYSFAAGTMDGPGDFDFTQGTTEGDYFWDFVRNRLQKPSVELQKCHAPKPILLATGELNFPFAWQPSVVEIQILRVGSLLIVGLPGEFTTMSGRRIRQNVLETATSIHRKNGKDPAFQIALSGLANTYSSYIATPEEYMLQRYEGASTIYGPYTLVAYMDKFADLTQALLKGNTLRPGEVPYVPNHIGFLPPVIYDSAPLLHTFGDVLMQPELFYHQENATVHVTFVSANPRNHLHNSSFLLIQRLDAAHRVWVDEFDDANWETKFKWSRPDKIDHLLGRSVADIYWEVRPWNGACKSGTYRIKHFGTAKRLPFGELLGFSGVSDPFLVTCGM